MTRRALLVVGSVVAVLVLVALGRDERPHDGPYRVDVVFDTAKGIVPGQLVKIAGARVGTVDDVALTPERKARLSLAVEPEFGPFRANARCTIKPEGLLSENFVQCDPGTSRAAPLRGRGDAPPTVPVERTSLPVNLNDLFDIWNVPTRERLRLLVDELGIATSGRGEDLDALLRRTNPALGSARRVLRILGDQDTQLAAAIDATDVATDDLARRPDGLAGLVREASAVAQRTARARAPLADAVRRLPPLLRAARPALRRLDTTATAARPVLADLRAAAPRLRATLRAAPALERAAAPTLAALGRPARRATRAIDQLQPVVRGLAAVAAPLGPVARRLDELTANLQQRGAIEGVLGLFYRTAVVAARFDAVSHMINGFYAYGTCSLYINVPVDGCSAHIGPVVGKSEPLSRRERAAGNPAAAAPKAPGTTAPAAPEVPKAPPTTTPTTPQLPKPDVPPLPERAAPIGEAVDDLLGFLLGS